MHDIDAGKDQRMRKGIMTNERDYKILHYLYYGPAAVSYIFFIFFDTDEKHKKTRWRVMLRRLQKMQDANLIQIIEDNRADDRILILGKKGAELVCNVHSLEIENAWTHAGKNSDFYHDLTTAQIARNFIFNAKDEIEVNLEFEHFLKKVQQRKNGNINGLGYPDFRVHLGKKDNEEQIYDVERDCCTIGKHSFEKKLCSSQYPLLIVTDTMQRVKWIYMNARELQVSRRVFIVRIKQLPKNIYSPFKCWSPPNTEEITFKIGEE